MADVHVFPKKELHMSSEEMAKIALAVVRSLLKDGITIGTDFSEELEVDAKKAGVDVERFKIFNEIIAREILEETFK